jgi:hypothetical protein
MSKKMTTTEETHHPKTKQNKKPAAWAGAAPGFQIGQVRQIEQNAIQILHVSQNAITFLLRHAGPWGDGPYIYDTPRLRAGLDLDPAAVNPLGLCEVGHGVLPALVGQLGRLFLGG